MATATVIITMIIIAIMATTIITIIWMDIMACIINRADIIDPIIQIRGTV